MACCAARAKLPLLQENRNGFEGGRGEREPSAAGTSLLQVQPWIRGAARYNVVKHSSFSLSLVRQMSGSGRDASRTSVARPSRATEAPTRRASRDATRKGAYRSRRSAGATSAGRRHAGAGKSHTRGRHHQRRLAVVASRHVMVLSVRLLCSDWLVGWLVGIVPRP